MPLSPKPPACEGCPAYNSGRGFVPGRGPEGADVLLLGQGPGETEAYQGLPFVGPSGERLNLWLQRAGLQRHHMFVSNIVWCWLPWNREPRAAEVEHCRHAHWGPQLDAAAPRLVVPVGVPAARALLGRATENSAGTVFEVDGRQVLPVLHPAHIQRGAWHQEPFQITYLRRVPQLLDGSLQVTDPEQSPPGWVLEPTADDLADFEVGITDEGVACDIEAAGHHITIVGLCRMHDLAGVTLEFRGPEGVVADSSKSHLEAKLTLLYRVLANPDWPVVFHFGQTYDQQQLELNGFEVAAGHWDTSLMARIAYPEMALGLEHLSKVFLGTTGWKHLVAEEDAVEGK